MSGRKGIRWPSKEEEDYGKRELVNTLVVAREMQKKNKSDYALSRKCFLENLKNHQEFAFKRYGIDKRTLFKLVRIEEARRAAIPYLESEKKEG